jgi:hypothetical protein
MSINYFSLCVNTYALIALKYQINEGKWLVLLYTLASVRRRTGYAQQGNRCFVDLPIDGG